MLSSCRSEIWKPVLQLNGCFTAVTSCGPAQQFHSVSVHFHTFTAQSRFEVRLCTHTTSSSFPASLFQPENQPENWVRLNQTNVKTVALHLFSTCEATAQRSDRGPQETAAHCLCRGLDPEVQTSAKTRASTSCCRDNKGEGGRAQKRESQLLEDGGREEEQKLTRADGGASEACVGISD